jgi:Flp pilus assembly protein TadG
LVWQAFKKFRNNSTGNIAVIFAIALVPMIAATGMVIDYSRAAKAHQQMQDALDATALFLSKSPSVSAMSSSQMLAAAQTYFNVNFTNHDASQTRLSPSYSAEGPSVTVSGSTSVPSTFMSVLGVKSIPVSGTATAEWGHERLRVALVLDNTGSMLDSGKIGALRTATTSLLAQLKNAASVDGDVYVSIIPFVKDVNVGAGNYNNSWDEWLDWDSLTEDTGDYPEPHADEGPGSTCPWSSSSRGNTSYHCVTQPGGSRGTSTVPASGSYNGYICPDGDNSIGCYTSTAHTTSSSKTVSSGRNASCGRTSNCTCAGSGSRKVCSQTVTTTTYTHNWVVDPSLWNGCVSDRGDSSPGTGTGPDQTYLSAQSTTPYPVEQYSACPQAMMGLTYNWSALNTEVNNMQANGSTNQPIGLVWGWQSLVGGGPFTAPAMDPAYQYKQVIILLSDGLNTQDRWYGNGSDTSTAVDNRMYYKSGDTISGTCKNIKDQDIVVYTVQVNTGHDATSTLLQNCATDSSKFFLLTSASQIITTFQSIGTALSDLRLSS